jgi:hypothetical protein
MLAKLIKKNNITNLIPSVMTKNDEGKLKIEPLLSIKNQ